MVRCSTQGVGLTENIANELFNSGVDVITTGNHVWDQKEIYEFIKTENKLLRPLNMSGNLPGNGFQYIIQKKNLKVRCKSYG